MTKRHKPVLRVVAAFLTILMVFNGIQLPAKAADPVTIAGWSYTGTTDVPDKSVGDNVTINAPAGATTGSDSLYLEGAVYQGGISTGKG